MAIPVDEGRPGDIWRLRGADQPVLVSKRSELTITFKLAADPDAAGHGISSGDWSHTLQRFREDLSSLVKGDTAHVFVPETEVYILAVAENVYKASGKGWMAWRAGQSPTRDSSEGGLYFDPSSEWNLNGELVHRPFAMLHDGEEVTDAEAVRWRFRAPFWFNDRQGQRGSPAWPLTVPGDRDRTARLNATGTENEKALWSARAGAGPEVFDTEFPGW